MQSRNPVHGDARPPAVCSGSLSDSRRRRRMKSRHLRQRPRPGTCADKGHAGPLVRAPLGAASVTAAFVVSIGAAAAAALGFRNSCPAVSTRVSAFSVAGGNAVVGSTRFALAAHGKTRGVVAGTSRLRRQTVTAFDYGRCGVYLRTGRYSAHGGDDGLGARNLKTKRRQRGGEASMSAVAPPASTPIPTADFGEQQQQQQQQSSDEPPPTDGASASQSPLVIQSSPGLPSAPPKEPNIETIGAVGVRETETTLLQPNGGAGELAEGIEEGDEPRVDRSTKGSGFHTEEEAAAERERREWRRRRVVNNTPQRIFVSNQKSDFEVEMESSGEDRDGMKGQRRGKESGMAPGDTKRTGAKRLKRAKKSPPFPVDSQRMKGTVEFLSRSVARLVEGEDGGNFDPDGSRDGVDKNRRGRRRRVTSRMGAMRGDAVFFAEMDDRSDARSKEGQSKFLTREEELELGTAVRRFQRLLETKNKAEELMDREQTIEETAARAGMTCEEYRDIMNTGMGARQKIVLHNLPLVASLADKYKRNSGAQCLQTLIQEGTFGLIRAAEMFDPSKGFRFSTYATCWIDAKIRLAVQHQDRLIHVPSWVLLKYKKVTECVPFLRETLGREPTPEEIATQVLLESGNKARVDAEGVKKLQEWGRKHMVSIEGIDSRGKFRALDDEPGDREEMLVAGDRSVEASSDWDLFRDYLERCMIKDLSDLERKIVRMRVGLRGSKRSTTQHICKVLSLPYKVVAKEERSAMLKLGVGVEPEFFSDFFDQQEFFSDFFDEQ